MTPQELKSSILQLAIQGKLVEQRPEEGTAEELIDALCISDNVDGQRVKQKEITDILNEDKAFDIPSTWTWIKLGSVCVIARGGSPRPIKEYITTSSDGVNWIKIGDTEKGGKYISSTAEKIKPSGVSKSRMVHSGDFLLTNSMSFGRPYILKVDGCIHDGWLVISPSEGIFDQDFLYWILSSGYAYQQFCDKVSGAVVKNLNSDKVANSVFPLPPLAEQKRIVAKIEELLPYIDRYEQAWSKLEEFNKRFPVDMQKSILQMAIQGKLVEQRPGECSGEDIFKKLKPYHRSLKPCKDELNFSAMDFDIPENWLMVELNQVFDFVDYRGKTPTKITEGVFLITASNIKKSYMDYTRKEYISHEEYQNRQSRGLTQKGDLLFTTEAPMGNAALCDLDECSCGQRIITFKEYSEGTALPALFMYFILSPQFQQQLLDNCTGTTAKGIKADKLKHFLIPLPPYEEQKRIVARLEELLPLCERLK